MKKIIVFVCATVAVIALTAATFVPANFGRIVKRTHVVATNYTVLYSDEYVALGGTSQVVTLPAAIVQGLQVKLAAIGANTVTVQPGGTDTIGLLTNSFTLGPTNSVILISDGTSNWER